MARESDRERKGERECERECKSDRSSDHGCEGDHDRDTFVKPKASSKGASVGEDYSRDDEVGDGNGERDSPKYLSLKKRLDIRETLKQCNNIKRPTTTTVMSTTIVRKRKSS